MFNVGVMYERGTVVARDPARALEWYRKASAAGVSMATHNMALMYREGDGVPADYDRAAELLLAASRHGMSASMYALGTMFEAGSHGRGKSPVQAIVWYAMALQFQRADPATRDSDLARHAAAKVAALQRTLSDTELRQAQAMGEHEFSLIMTVLRGGDVPAPAVPSTAASAAPAAPGKPPAATPKKPASARERLIDVQKMLLALRIYGGKVDGVKGPKTRAAIRKFQRMAGLPASDETSDEFVQLLREQAQLVDRK
jgi:enhanced entry protein LpnE